MDTSRSRSSTRTTTSTASVPTSNAPPSSLYHIVMTPVNFVIFLFSLLIVDFQYSLKRSHNHAEAHSRLPSWLHALLYRPYEDERAPRASVGGRWYYHTKQKKLLRMEAEDAFRLRSTMLVFLAMLATGAVAGSWWLIRSLVRPWLPALPA